LTSSKIIVENKGYFHRVKKMLTILCSPKPFVGEAAWNQVNALRSWRAIDPKLEIIIFGAVQGAAEAAEAVDAQHVTDIEFSLSGAPSFNAMAQYGAMYGHHDLQIYVNCDILLNHSLVKAMQIGYEKFGRFLLVGERLDLAMDIKIDICNLSLADSLISLANEEKLIPHGPTGADYFGFIRGLWRNLPPVYMGRAMCDNALINYCLKNNYPVIDSTLAVMAIHQYHGYGHVPGGRQEVFNGGDRDTMARAHNLNHSLPTIADANWRFSENGTLQPDRFRRHFLRRLEYTIRYKFGLEWAALGIRVIQYLFVKQAVIPRNLSFDEMIIAYKNQLLSIDIS
jgi:hypothetical protein